MRIYILICLLNSIRQILSQRILAGPSPVEWPDMNRQIVNVLAGMDLLVKRHVVLAAETALVAAGNHMVRVNGLDQCSCLA